MIALEYLAKTLENTLNGTDENGNVDYSNITKFGLDGTEADENGNYGGILPRTTFRFRVVSDLADYKKAEREDNTAVFYIHAVMKAEGSTVEGIVKEAYNARLNTSVEFLIPFVDILDENGNSKIVAAVRNLIDTVLQARASQTVTIDNICYYQGTQYHIADTGTRDQRAQVGDSISLSVSVDYIFLALGVGSNSIVISINGDRVYYSKLGISRQIVSEGNIEANGGSPVSKNAVAGSALAVNMDMPTRLNAYDKAIALYVLTGEIVPVSVSLTIPVEIDNNGGIISETRAYKMVFSFAGINGELNYGASTSVSLVEVME